MKNEFDRNMLPENTPSPKAAQTPSLEKSDDHFRLGLRIAAFLGALMLLLGLTGLWLKYQEQPVTATITAVGPVTTHTRRNRKHGSSRTVTTSPLTLRIEEDGEIREETVTFQLHSRWILPQPGQTVQVTKNPFGVYVAWPDQNLESVSYVLIIFGCIVLLFSLLLLRNLSNVERENLLRSAEISREGAKPPVARSERVTERVTLQPDGFYSWYGKMDNTYYRNEQYNGVKLLIGILLFILTLLAVFLQSWEYILIVAGVFGFVVLLTLGIVLLTVDGEGTTRELYTMSDEWVKAGSGKTSSYFTFSKARQVTFLPRYVELRGRVKTLRIYVPAEDMLFVQDHIRSRLLPGTDVADS